MGRRYAIKSRPNSWVERDSNGRFKDWTNRQKSLQRDRATQSKNVVKSGYGHLGDQKPRTRFAIKMKVGNRFKSVPSRGVKDKRDIMLGIKKPPQMFVMKIRGKRILDKIRL